MTAKPVQTRFEFAIFSIHFDLHVFSNSDAAHLWHSKMAHRVAHRVALGIEHCSLWHDEDFYSHRLTIFATHRTNKCNSNHRFPHHSAGFFVIAQTHKNRRAELSIAGPFREFDFAYEDRIYPMHFAHRRWRDSLHPFSILLRRKIDKGAIVALFLSEFIMQHVQ